MHVETKTNVLLLFWTFFVTRRRNRDNDVPSTRHGLCVRHECDLCHLFYIPIVYQLLSNQSNQRMEFIVILFRLKLVKKSVFPRKRDYENVRNIAVIVQLNSIIFDIDQDVILTWQIIKYTSIIVFCRNLINRNKCLHPKNINYI